jgi:hypothetical protein
MKKSLKFNTPLEELQWGFFFPSGTERRIHLEPENMKQVLQYVKNSFNVIKALSRG